MDPHTVHTMKPVQASRNPLEALGKSQLGSKGFYIFGPKNVLWIFFASPRPERGSRFTFSNSLLIHIHNAESSLFLQASPQMDPLNHLAAPTTLYCLCQNVGSYCITGPSDQRQAGAKERLIVSISIVTIVRHCMGRGCSTYF